MRDSGEGVMQAQRDIQTTIKSLCRISEAQFADPFKKLHWPDEMDKEQWHFTPELISIHGMPEYDALTEEQRKRLSFHEAVNFFSLNIHGEKALIEGLARNLYVRSDPDISPYLHHFLDEENKHMIYFGRFCSYYAGKVYADKKLAFPREYAPGEEELLFFAKVMIFEEVVDVYNKTMGDDARLVPLVRDINRFHHVDESRHLAFGRTLVKSLYERYRAEWADETRISISEYLQAYLALTWREYYNAAVYADAGLDNPYELQERAYARPEARAHREKISRQCIQFLLNMNILLEEPAL
jgi:hypothetical protein